MNDPIDRQAAIDALGGNEPVGDPSKMDDYDVVKMWERIRIINIINKLPSAQPYTEAELQKMQDLYQAEIDKAFELGQEDARSEIIHCGECKHRDPEDHKCDCGHDILWQLPRDDRWYCADAERKG